MSRSADSIELQALLEPLTTDTARPPPFLTQQLYENLPLHPGSRCIRLLRLHCNYKQPHAPLTGELSVVDLRSSPSFAALSYVWGDISYPRPTITCQGCQFELTNNCRDALLALRDQFGEILIWVDAICINQNDTAEKGEQVSLCSEIYSWARTVYIWLGNDDDNESARKAIECLETAVGFSIVPPQAPHFAIHQKKNIFRGKVALLIKIMAAEYFYVPFGFYARARKRFRKRFKADSLAFLLNKNWLHRSWTFQEIILAANPVLVTAGLSIDWTVFQCGLICSLQKELVPRDQILQFQAAAFKSAFSWRSLHSFWLVFPRPSQWNEEVCPPMSEERNLSVADYHSHFRELQFLSSIASVLIGLLLPVFWYLQGMEFSVMGGLTLLLGLYEFWCWIAMKWNGGLSITAVIESPRKEYFLMAVLSTLLERQASQPEDKAFALNGILSRFWDRPLAKPDYAKPYGIVYKDLFLELLAWSSHCMNLLLNAGSNQADMPTWVPDWKTTDNRKWLRYENQYFHISEDQYFFSYSGGTLHVEAVIGGTVNLCCDLILPIESLQRVEESPDRSSPAPLALSKFLAAVSKDFRSRSRPEPCPNGRCSWGLCRAFCESFQYALNGISNARPAHAPQSHHTRSDEEHPRLRSQGQDIADTLQEGSAFCGVAKSTQSLDQAQSDISELNAKVSRILDGQRRLFFAGVNRIGTSVPAIRTGDKIALIKGVAIPMILRGVTGTSNRFTVVGPAFVSGFAQGPSYTGAGEFNQIELV